MSYFRHSYADFQEFQREAFAGGDGLGKEELELLEELEDDDAFYLPRRRRDDWG